MRPDSAFPCLLSQKISADGFDKISGPELVELYQKQLKANNLEVTQDEVVGIEKKDAKFLISTKSGKTYEAISVIITSGASSRLINVPGEEEFAGKGVSYCSLCDGPVFKNKIVAVIGGGNNGFESALFLSNYVPKVYILEYGAKMVKIEGKVFVESITYQDLTANTEKTLEVKGVFVEIGYIPATTFVNGLVDLNNKGEIMFDANTLATKTPGLFSAGDCNVSKYKQIVMASGEGAKAALSAYEYIKKQSIIKNHYE